MKANTSKKKQYYSVDIDMRWSVELRVKAGSEAEAKRIAWEKFKKNPPKRNFDILADKSEAYL